MTDKFIDKLRLIEKTYLVTLERIAGNRRRVKTTTTVKAASLFTARMTAELYLEKTYGQSYYVKPAPDAWHITDITQTHDAAGKPYQDRKGILSVLGTRHVR